MDVRTVLYRDECLSGTVIHFLRALLRRAWKEKCRAGPVGGGDEEEYPGLGSKIRDETEAQMQLKVTRRYPKEEAMRVAAVPGTLATSLERTRLQSVSSTPPPPAPSDGRKPEQEIPGAPRRPRSIHPQDHLYQCRAPKLLPGTGTVWFTVFTSLESVFIFPDSRYPSLLSSFELVCVACIIQKQSMLLPAKHLAGGLCLFPAWYRARDRMFSLAKACPDL